MACTLCGISVFLLIAAIFNADWANSDGWREGLFLQCVDKDISTPLPFNQPIEMAGSDGCHSRVKCNQGKCIQENAAEEENADKPQKVKYGDKEIEVVEYMPQYMKKVLILLVIGLLLDIGGTVFTGMGAKSDDKEKIQRYNKLAIILFVGSCKYYR